ncbi:MAG: hypothetical protein ACOC1O_03815 [bacterium]
MEVVFDVVNKGDLNIELAAYDENDNKISSVGVDFITKIDVILTTVDITRISLDENNLGIVKGKNYKLTATIEPKNATNKNIS